MGDYYHGPGPIDGLASLLHDPSTSSSVHSAAGGAGPSNMYSSSSTTIEGATSAQQLNQYGQYTGSQHHQSASEAYLAGPSGSRSAAADYEPRQQGGSHAGPSTSSAASATTAAADTANANLNHSIVMRKSCQHCRKRKIRCISAGPDIAACKACLHKGQPCVFEKQSTMGRPPKSKKRESSDGEAAYPDGVENTPGSQMATQLAPASNKQGTSPASSSTTAAHLGSPPKRQVQNGGLPDGNAKQSVSDGKNKSKKHKSNAHASSHSTLPAMMTSQIPQGQYPQHQHLSQPGLFAPPFLDPGSWQASPPSAGGGSYQLPLPMSMPSPYGSYPHPMSFDHLASTSAPSLLTGFTGLHYAGAGDPFSPQYSASAPLSSFQDLHDQRQLHSHYPAPDSHRMSISGPADQSNTPASVTPLQNIAALAGYDPAALHSPNQAQQAQKQHHRRVSQLSSLASSSPINLPSPSQQPQMPITRYDAPDLDIWQQKLQRDGDLFAAFSNEPLSRLVSAFFESLTSYSTASTSAPRSPTPASLADPSVSAEAKVRTLFSRAVSARKPWGLYPEYKRDPHQHASAEYARSIVSPLWEGVPVDIIALVTTGRPSQSGPFALGSQQHENAHRPGSSRDSRRSASPPIEEYLFAKLLREDESNGWAITELPAVEEGSSGRKPRTSPYLAYANSKAAVGKYFHGYFSRHPLAPLIINERLFIEDLANDRADDLLLNVIVGSAIARAPCLMGTGPDARDVGEYFYAYIREQMFERSLEECLTLETCQSLILWAAHEIAHLRQRRATALLGVAEVLLRERLRRFQIAAAARQASNEAGIPASSEPLGWREIVEHELTVNGLWILSIINTWASLSLKLPHASIGVLTQSLPAPPASVALSSSFHYAYSLVEPGASILPSQHVVRRVIERFSDATHVLRVIVAIKSQSRLKSLLAPDPPRPMAIASEGDDAHVAMWLLDLAKQFKQPDFQQQGLPLSASALEMTMAPGTTNTVSAASSPNAVAIAGTMSESSRAFLVVSHAIMALYQLLPFAPPAPTEQGVPAPLPTVESLKTALHALYLLSRSITASAPNSRTRTQALLLDAMPRVIALLDLFTTTSLDSLDHFILVTSHRDMIGELLRELSVACMALETSSPQHSAAGGSGNRVNFERAKLALQSVTQLGQGMEAALKPAAVVDEADGYTQQGVNPHLQQQQYQQQQQSTSHMQQSWYDTGFSHGNQQQQPFHPAFANLLSDATLALQQQQQQQQEQLQRATQPMHRGSIASPNASDVDAAMAYNQPLASGQSPSMQVSPASAGMPTGTFNFGVGGGSSSNVGSLPASGTSTATHQSPFGGDDMGQDLQGNPFPSDPSRLFEFQQNFPMASAGSSSTNDAFRRQQGEGGVQYHKGPHTGSATVVDNGGSQQQIKTSPSSMSNNEHDWVPTAEQLQYMEQQDSHYPVTASISPYDNDASAAASRRPSNAGTAESMSSDSSTTHQSQLQHGKQQQQQQSSNAHHR